MTLHPYSNSLGSTAIWSGMRPVPSFKPAGILPSNPDQINETRRRDSCERARKKSWLHANWIPSSVLGAGAVHVVGQHDRMALFWDSY